MDVFITGGSGLLGVKLLQRLTADEKVENVYLLARNPQKTLDSLKKVNSDKIIVFQGDICSSNFGLSKENISLLKNVSNFYHLAASVHLGSGEKVEEILYNTNVKGTENALKLLEAMPALENFIFVSSAYACGYYPEIVPESWLLESTFRNYYEKSKWQCEQLIKDKLSESRIVYSIIRPSILLDDLDSEKISKQTIYLFAGILHNIVGHNQESVRLIGNPNSCLNFVFADDLVNFMIKIIGIKESRIYNFVSSTSISVNELLISIKEGLKIPNVLLSKNNLELTKTENKLDKAIEAFQPYLTINKLTWQVENKQKIINDVDLKRKESILNNIRSYCEMLK